MNITRRSFIKRTAFTAAAVTVLGQGVALCDPVSSGSGSTNTSTSEPDLEYDYSLLCKTDPATGSSEVITTPGQQAQNGDYGGIFMDGAHQPVDCDLGAPNSGAFGLFIKAWGPEEGQIAKIFRMLDGTTRAQFSNNVDDGSPIDLGGKPNSTGGIDGNMVFDTESYESGTGSMRKTYGILADSIIELDDVTVSLAKVNNVWGCIFSPKNSPIKKKTLSLDNGSSGLHRNMYHSSVAKSNTILKAAATLDMAEVTNTSSFHFAIEGSGITAGGASGQSVKEPTETPQLNLGLPWVFHLLRRERTKGTTEWGEWEDLGEAPVLNEVEYFEQSV